MKKLVLLFVLCSIAGVSLVARSVTGNGNVVKIEREVSSFKEIYAAGVFELIIRQAEHSPLVIESDENLLPLVSAVVSGGKLRLELNGDVRNPTVLKVYINIPELNRIDISGASKANLENDFQSSDFTAILSGASRVNIEHITANNIRLDINGASTINANCKSDDFTISNSGASKGTIEGSFKKMNARADGASKTELIAKVENTVKISASGTGKLSGSLDADVIHATANGASAIIFSGKCKKQYLNANGSSAVKMNKMDSQESDISASGASRIEVGRTYITKMQSSGAASIKTGGIVKRKKINIHVENSSTEAKQLSNDLSKIQLDLENTSQADLNQLGEEFISLLNQLKSFSDNAMIEVNSKTYLLKDVKIATAKKKTGKLALFINGEEVYEFN